MAKNRRIIRKLKTAAPTPLEDQLWPLNMALVLLGGFLAGVVIVNLRFDDPRWWANGWLWLSGVVAAVCTAMAVLRYVSNRWIRRSMQLALVLSLIVNLGILVGTKYVEYVRNIQLDRSSKDLVSIQRPKVVPDYDQLQLQHEQRPKQDFEKPVETDTPEPQPDDIQREEQEHKQQPIEVQPTPVPEPEKTLESSLVRKQDTSATVPRQSEQTSRLSRQETTARQTPNQTVAVPQPNDAPPQRSEAVQPSPSTVSRQTPRSAPASQAMPSPDESTPEPRTTPSLARQPSQAEPTPELASKAAMPRTRTQATAEPRTETPQAEAPAVAQQTSPDAVQPQNTEAVKQSTASPEAAREALEPAPEQVAESATQVQRRQNPAEPQPDVAQTPTPVVQREARLTPRPDAETVARRTSAVESPAAESTQPSPQPGATTLARQATSRQLDRSAATEPAATAAPPATRPVERQSSADARPSNREPQAAQLTRRATQPTPLPQTESTVADATAVTRRTQADAISPTSTATRKQTTATEHAAPDAALDATVASRREVPTREPTHSTGRRAQAEDAPSVASTEATRIARHGAAVSDAPPVETTAEQVAASSPVRASDGELRATASEVARQPSAQSTTSRSQQNLETPAASPTTQLANRVSRRATEANAPSLEASAVPSESPQRASVTGELASPVAVAQPSASRASQTGQPAAVEPAATALAKAETGTAGSGQAANLDRRTAAPESPSLVPSGSVRRADTTQATPEGSDLSPNEPAEIARNVAGSERPASTLKAEPVAVATARGASEPEELAATASAATSRLTSNANTGEVTAVKGSVEVDLGPTRIVSESGENTDRASGGGQPDVLFAAENDPANPARSQPETTLGALATTTRAEVATAPQEEGSSSAVALDANPQSQLASRTDSGGEQTATGAPAMAPTDGPPAEPNAANLRGELAMSRATAPGQQDPGSAEAAAPEEDDEEEEKERARRVARAAAGGGPQLALAGPSLADQPQVPSQTGGEATGPAGPQAVAATDLQRTETSEGNPAASSSSAAGPIAGRAASQELAGAAAPGGAAVAGPLDVKRAEPVDAPRGEAIAGGGTASATRSSTGRPYSAPTRAETIRLAGGPESSGQPQGEPLAAQGVAVEKTGGNPGVSTDNPPAALATADGRQSGTAGTPGDLQRRDASEGGGPPAADPTTDVGAPGRRGPRMRLATSTTADTDVSSPGDIGGGQPQPSLDNLANAGNAGPMRRQPSSALPVSIEAMEGPGGLGVEVSRDTGLNSRRAQAESDQVQIRASRFQRRQPGGLPDFNTAAVVASEPFRRRASRNEGDTPGGSRGRVGPQTEEAIERGLAFLKRYQRSDGSWSLRGFPEDASTFDSDSAATGLAVLAFQGGGYNHLEFKHAEVVRAGLDYLVSHQQENGDLYVPEDGYSNQYAWLYSHGIATLALCEAYGMTQDANLREPAQKAIDFIVESQDRDHGGWRYTPNTNSDTSVAGWMMMALTSARFANLDVPQEALDRASHWLDLCQAGPAQRHLYCYNAFAENTPESRLGREPSTTMTSVGLLMRLYSGWERQNPHMQKGADYLADHLPSLGFAAQPPHRKQRDTYYWYYATQFMFHMGGEHWEQWYQQLRPLLLDYQVQEGALAGSWDPLRPVPDRWGPQAGRLYVTCLNLLSLEVHYRILPLYDKPKAKAE